MLGEESPTLGVPEASAFPEPLNLLSSVPARAVEFSLELFFPSKCHLNDCPGFIRFPFHPTSHPYQDQKWSGQIFPFPLFAHFSHTGRTPLPAQVDDSLLWTPLPYSGHLFSYPPSTSAVSLATGRSRATPSSASDEEPCISSSTLHSQYFVSVHLPQSTCCTPRKTKDGVCNGIV